MLAVCTAGYVLYKTSSSKQAATLKHQKMARIISLSESVEYSDSCSSFLLGNFDCSTFKDLSCCEEVKIAVDFDYNKEVHREETKRERF